MTWIAVLIGVPLVATALVFSTVVIAARADAARFGQDARKAGQAFSEVDHQQVHIAVTHSATKPWRAQPSPVRFPSPSSRRR